jgi:hypothetical protein
VVRIHYRLPKVEGERHDWKYSTEEGEAVITPLIIGNLTTAKNLFTLESTWDGLTIVYCYHLSRNLEMLKSHAVIITRGAGNGALIKGKVRDGQRVYAFPQNDRVEKPGVATAAEKWLACVVKNACAPVLVVKTPSNHKDFNDWLRAGGTLVDFHKAVSEARPAPPGRELSHQEQSKRRSFAEIVLENSDSDVEPRPFPTFALPEPFGSLVKEVARVHKVPESMSGAIALGNLSAAVGRGLMGKLLPGRITPANIYVMVVAKSGVGKSSTADPILEPLNAMDSILKDRWRREDLPRLEARRVLLAKEIERLVKGSGRGNDEAEQRELELNLATKNAQLSLIQDQLIEPSILCEDISTQKLAVVMQQNGETGAVISTDAGDVVSNLLGRFNRLERADDTLYVKGYSGDTVRVGRIGRPSIVLNKPCLTQLLLLQPDKLHSLMASRQLVDGGLLPRFLIVSIRGAPAHLEAEESEISIQVRVAYTKRLEEIVSGLRLASSARIVEATMEAREALRDYYNRSADRRASLPPELDSFAARWAEQACRLSLLIHVAKWGADAVNQPLDVDSAQRGVELAKWFAEQQVQLLQSNHPHELERILNGIENMARNKPEGFTGRDLYKAGIVQGPEEAERIMEGLIAQGLATAERKQTGGRPSVTYQLKEQEA